MNISIFEKKKQYRFISPLYLSVITNPITTNQIFQTKKTHSIAKIAISVRGIERGKREQRE